MKITPILSFNNNSHYPFHLLQFAATIIQCWDDGLFQVSLSRYYTCPTKCWLQINPTFAFLCIIRCLDFLWNDFAIIFSTLFTVSSFLRPYHAYSLPFFLSFSKPAGVLSSFLGLWQIGSVCSKSMNQW